MSEQLKNTLEGTNACADNCGTLQTPQKGPMRVRTTVEQWRTRVRVTAYHYRNPRLCDRDRMIIVY